MVDNDIGDGNTIDNGDDLWLGLTSYNVECIWNTTHRWCWIPVKDERLLVICNALSCPIVQSCNFSAHLQLHCYLRLQMHIFVFVFIFVFIFVFVYVFVFVLLSHYFGTVSTNSKFRSSNCDLCLISPYQWFITKLADRPLWFGPSPLAIRPLTSTNWFQTFSNVVALIQSAPPPHRKRHMLLCYPALWCLMVLSCVMCYKCCSLTPVMVYC